MWHQERLPPPRLRGRCGFGEATFAGDRGDGEDAPISDLPALVQERGGWLARCSQLDLLCPFPNITRQRVVTGVRRFTIASLVPNLTGNPRNRRGAEAC